MEHGGIVATALSVAGHRYKRIFQIVRRIDSNIAVVRHKNAISQPSWTRLRAGQKVLWDRVWEGTGGAVGAQWEAKIEGFVYAMGKNRDLLLVHGICNLQLLSISFVSNFVRYGE